MEVRVGCVQGDVQLCIVGEMTSDAERIDELTKWRDIRRKEQLRKDRSPHVERWMCKPSRKIDAVPDAGQSDANAAKQQQQQQQLQ